MTHRAKSSGKRPGPRDRIPRREEGDFDEAIRNLQDIMDQDTMRIYPEEVLRQCGAPHNVGRLEPADGRAVVSGQCGDTMEITLRVSRGVILDCAFFTDGCGATVACGSAVTQLAKNRKIEEALDITSAEVEAFLGGLPESHRHCAGLASETLLRAILSYVEGCAGKPTFPSLPGATGARRGIRRFGHRKAASRRR